MPEDGYSEVLQVADGAVSAGAAADWDAEPGGVRDAVSGPEQHHPLLCAPVQRDGAELPEHGGDHGEDAAVDRKSVG